MHTFYIVEMGYLEVHHGIDNFKNPWSMNV